MIRTELRPYQQLAVRAASSHDGFALFPEQRTGKTLTSLAIVDQKKPDHLLIICPKKALLEWETQIKTHLEFDWDCEVEIVHFEACSRSKKSRAHYRKKARTLIKKGQSIFVICDEAHRIKKRGSYQSRLVRSLGKLANWRLALTGTPIAQGIQDVWAIFEFILPGIFGKWEDFSNEYLKFGGFEKRKVIGYKNEESFNEIFHRHSYRISYNEARRSVGLGSPKIRRKKVFFDLTPESRRIYGEFQEELESEVRGVKVSTPMVVTLTMKLQQIAGGYLINDVQVPGKKKKERTVYRVGEEKLKTLGTLLGEFYDEQLVICARFKHEIEKIAVLVEERGFTQKIIAGGSEYDGKFDTDIIIMQIQSGIAIDLSVSNNYIFYSWDFSYINYEQTKFRVLSFATKQVNYYYLMARETVDGDIYDAVCQKKDLATLICDRYRRERNVQKAERTSSRNPGGDR